VNRKFHLTQSRDFARVKNYGKVARHNSIILVYTQNDLDISRFAVVASKKIGTAVVRNRVRRRIKACLQEQWKHINPGWDLIFYSRTAIITADYQEIEGAIKHLLLKAGVL